MILQDMDHIIFAGDSVTDANCAGALAAGLEDNLGFGYVRMIENILTAWRPDLRIQVSNSGKSGNTSRTLLERFDRDVIQWKPDWVSICIGINDVWRQFDMPAFPHTHVLPEEYRENVRKMIELSKAHAKGVILCTPFFMESNREDPMRKRMDEYSQICRELAEEYGCIFVDFQAMYDRFFEHCHPALLAWDRVHPNQKAATLMARELLTACGFDFGFTL